MIESYAPWQFSLHESPRRRRLRVGEKALGGFVLLHAALRQKNDVISEAGRLPEIMRRHQHLGTLGANFADDALDRLGGAGVKAGGRFVEQQQARAHRPGAGQRQALALAAGKQAGRVACAIGQADAFQHLGRPRPAFG